jgi:NTE family protein
VALVLSGGSARGFAHVGVIKVLEANGLRPSLVVGSSAGSLVGALYASGLRPEELERAAGSLDFGTLGDWIVPGSGLFRLEPGLLRGNGLRDFVNRWSRHARIEDFPIRFAAIATDLRSGSVVVFNAGDAGTAVLASCAVPGLIAPVQIQDRLIGDGQISSPLPVAAARVLGADRVIAVDVLYPPADAEITGVVDVLFQAGIVAANRLKDMEAAGADLLIRPRIPPTTGQYGFEQREQLIAAGEAAAYQALEGVRRQFAIARHPGVATGR